MMTLTAPPHRITIEEFLRMPDNSIYELVNGQIEEKNVSLLSAKTEAWITSLLAAFAARASLASVLSSTLSYQCFEDLGDDPDRMRRPDITVVKAERLKALADPNPGYMTIIPDLAVEVLSTNDLFSKVDLKLRDYRMAGFPLVWVVDPIARTVTVHPNPGKPFILSEDDDIRAENVLPGFVCKVAELFPAN